MSAAACSDDHFHECFKALNQRGDVLEVRKAALDDLLRCDGGRVDQAILVRASRSFYEVLRAPFFEFLKQHGRHHA
jgi:hypothetical protein